MGLMAERGAQRMQARQTYRTMARMQRRRSFVQSRVGMREDFGRQEQPAETAAPTAPARVRAGVRGRAGAARPAPGSGHPQRRGVRGQEEADPRYLKTGEFVIDASTPGRL